MGLFPKLVVLGVAVLAAAVIWQWMHTVDIEEFYQGKRIILTGASRGIGKRLAIQLARLGAKLVIAARSVDKLTETQQECQQYTPHVHTVVADVSKETDCKAIVEKTITEFGGVDILILNAANVTFQQWFTEIENPGEHYINIFRVNLLQSVYLVHSALSHLNSSHGIIVPISSMGGTLGVPRLVSYITTKHALQGFFKGLNQEFIMANTHVSITIMPLPFVLTQRSLEVMKPKDNSSGITPEECADRIIQGIPLRKLWYYIDWEGFLVCHLYSLFPELFEYLTRFGLSTRFHYS